MKKVSRVFRLTLGSLATLALTSCGGGGGGGDDFIGAALASIDASPSQIDTGDRTQVSVELMDVNRNGIALKVAFPDSLFYVPQSARLILDNNEENSEDISPTVNQGDPDKNIVYLVFYLKKSDFNEDGAGKVIFQLEGKDEVRDGIIGVDPDVDDPDISNATEFDIENPEYGAEDQTSIEVVN